MESGQRNMPDVGRAFAAGPVHGFEQFSCPGSIARIDSNGSRSYGMHRELRAGAPGSGSFFADHIIETAGSRRSSRTSHARRHSCDASLIAIPYGKDFESRLFLQRLSEYLFALAVEPPLLFHRSPSAPQRGA
jgi:hypothetical protein